MQDSTAQRGPSGLGITLSFVAAVLMIATGLILMMYGFFELIGDYGRTTDIPFHIGVTGWGIIHMASGALLLLAGCNLFVGKYWARNVAIGCACLAILGALMSIEAYTIWAIALIVLNIGIIWALLFHARDISFD